MPDVVSLTVCRPSLDAGFRGGAANVAPALCWLGFLDVSSYLYGPSCWLTLVVSGLLRATSCSPSPPLRRTLRAGACCCRFCDSCPPPSPQRVAGKFRRHRRLFYCTFCWSRMLRRFFRQRTWCRWNGSLWEGQAEPESGRPAQLGSRWGANFSCSNANTQGRTHERVGEQVSRSEYESVSGIDEQLIQRQIFIVFSGIALSRQWDCTRSLFKERLHLKLKTII